MKKIRKGDIIMDNRSSVSVSWSVFYIACEDMDISRTTRKNLKVKLFCNIIAGNSTRHVGTGIHTIVSAESIWQGLATVLI